MRSNSKSYKKQETFYYSMDKLVRSILNSMKATEIHIGQDRRTIISNGVGISSNTKRSQLATCLGLKLILKKK